MKLAMSAEKNIQKPIYRHAPPLACLMIEALRGLGYTTSTALADIIDNSIAANADKVDILFSWAGTSSTIAVIDNGEGMDEYELDIAMRLGHKNLLMNAALTTWGVSAWDSRQHHSHNVGG